MESSELNWELPSAAMRLLDDEVHVWRANLRLHPEQVAALHATLSSDEMARAARFRFHSDRENYIVARGALRDILSRYTGDDAHSLAFSYSRFGKPAFASPCALDLQFNLSRSKGWAVYAFALRRVLGIDLEYVDMSIDDAAIVERFFSKSEIAAWKALPAPLRPQAFFNAWTRKEAFIKAIGEGLSMPLDSFDVTLVPGQSALITRPSPCTWSLVDLRPVDGFAAALVVDGSHWRLRCYEWTAR